MPLRRAAESGPATPRPGVRIRVNTAGHGV